MVMKLFPGIRFLLIGFDSVSESQYRSEIVNYGGVDAGRYDSTCTHVIVNDRIYDDPLCEAARRDGKVLVTGLWVEDSVTMESLADACRILYQPVKALKGISGAASLCICLTGYQNQERTNIVKMVGLMGAQFSKPLVAAKVTHLVCYKFEGEKYELAKRLNITLVNHRWLEDCLKAWEILPVENYYKSGWELEIVEAQASDSEKETEADMEFHNKTLGHSAIPTKKCDKDDLYLMRAEKPSCHLGKNKAKREVSSSSGPATESNACRSAGDIVKNDLLSTSNIKPEFTRNLGPYGSNNSIFEGFRHQNEKGHMYGDPNKETDEVLVDIRGNKRDFQEETDRKLGIRTFSRKTRRKSSLGPLSNVANRSNLKVTGLQSVEDHSQFGKNGLMMEAGITKSRQENDYCQNGTPDARLVKLTLSHPTRSKDSSEVSNGKFRALTYSRRGHKKGSVQSLPELWASPQGCSKESRVAHTLSISASTTEWAKVTSGTGIVQMSNVSAETHDRHSQSATSPPKGKAISAETYCEQKLQLTLLGKGIVTSSSVGVNCMEEEEKTVGSPRKATQSTKSKRDGVLLDEPYTGPTLSNHASALEDITDGKSVVDQNPQPSGTESASPKKLMKCGTEAFQSKTSTNAGLDNMPLDCHSDVPTLDMEDMSDSPLKQLNFTCTKMDVAVCGSSSLPFNGIAKLHKLQAEGRAAPLGNSNPKIVEMQNLGDAVGKARPDTQRKKVRAKKGMGSRQKPYIGQTNINVEMNSTAGFVNVNKTMPGSQNGEEGAEPVKSITDTDTEMHNLEFETSAVWIGEDEQEKLTLEKAGETSAVVMKIALDVEKENRPIDNGTLEVIADKLLLQGSAKSTQSSTNCKMVKSAVPSTEPVWFILSGRQFQIKKLQPLITQLKGRVCRDSHRWSYQATHLIVPDPVRRTEKFFASAAAGRWILKTHYLTASSQAGRFLEEEPFEWYDKGLSQDGAINLEAPRKWRLLRERTGHGALYRMRIIIYGECIAPSLDTLKRVLKAGDGVILATSPPYTRFLTSGVDFAVVSAGMPQEDSWIREFLRHEIPCVVPDYLVEYVCKPGYSLETHVLYDTQHWAEKSLLKLFNLSEKIVDSCTVTL